VTRSRSSDRRAGRAHRGRPDVRGLAALALLAASWVTAPAPARAQSDAPAPTSALRPLWELGAGLAGIGLPAYRGADQRAYYLLPLPYLIYRGQFLRSDRDGARAVFVDAERTEVDLSVAGSAPARGTVAARAGMASLPPTLEIGPNVNLTLWRAAAASRAEAAHLDLRLPLRTALALQRNPRAIGWVFTPNLNLDLPGVSGPGGAWNVGLGTGPLWGSQRYHQHFYGVAAAAAVDTPTLQRPAYTARGGYGGWQFTAAVSRRFEQAWAGAFVRYDTLAGAVFDDSPLVRRRQALSAGFGVAWVFAQSATQVDTRPGRGDAPQAALPLVAPIARTASWPE